MKLRLPDGEGGWYEVELDENSEICIENLLEDFELPTMSETLKGGAKVGKGLYMTDESLNAASYELPTASSSVKGGVKIGTGLTMNGDSVNATVYELPTMSETLKGGAKVGGGLAVDNDTLSVDLRKAVEYTHNEDYTEINTAIGKIVLGSGLSLEGDTLNAGTGGTINNVTQIFNNVVEGDSLVYVNNEGDVTGITLGDNFSIDNGVVNINLTEVIPLVLESVPSASGDTVVVENPYELPTMSEALKGGAKVGQGLYMDGDTLNADIANIAQTAASFVSVSSSESYEEYRGKTLSVVYVETETERNDLVDANREVCYRIPGKDSGGLSNIHYWGLGPDGANYLENGSGELILPEEYMDIDFRILNIDDKEIDVVGGLYDENTLGYNSRSNAASRKILRNGRTCVWLTNVVMNQLTEDKILIEWGFKSEKGNVNFKGTYLALPNNPVHGWLVYQGGRFQIYDATTTQWRNMN